MVESNDQKEYLAQSRLDEAVYTLLELGWSGEDIADKVENLIENFEDSVEEGEEESQSQR